MVYFLHDNIYCCILLHVLLVLFSTPIMCLSQGVALMYNCIAITIIANCFIMHLYISLQHDLEMVFVNYISLACHKMMLFILRFLHIVALLIQEQPQRKTMEGIFQYNYIYQALYPWYIINMKIT